MNTPGTAGDFFVPLLRAHLAGKPRPKPLAHFPHASTASNVRWNS
ncbi:hypothetical protein ACN9M1_24485 [Ralstonia sp. R-29]